MHAKYEVYIFYGSKVIAKIIVETSSLCNPRKLIMVRSVIVNHDGVTLTVTFFISSVTAEWIFRKLDRKQLQNINLPSLCFAG